MKQKLVKSVFEGDIFYWWEDSYRELKPGAALYSPQYEKQKARFGEALAEIILTLYKFDFSEIVGDPLGTLYQHYFDKETRKALGEFYTPKEVVEYILDAVGYEGRGVIGKRLLDPACGSGTFLVDALRRYLKASEEIAEEKGWPAILKELCDEFCIAGFDIHPFATFMAQMQFMLVLIPAYKKAMDEDPHFVLNRLPIFRTDSLVDETKGEAMKVTIATFESGIRYILIDTSLPVEGGNMKIKMPYYKDVFARTDLLNVQEYFAALQAVFDTVKESAWQEKYVVDKEKLERNFKLYLEDKDWNNLVSFFMSYAKHFLLKFKELKEIFGDGKLIKSVEDLMLAAILKNYVKYDFVVGNPPYVRSKKMSTNYVEYLSKTYPDFSHRKADLFVYFIGRGIQWLQDLTGTLGYITSNRFLFTKYGRQLRGFLLNNAKIKQIIDFGDSGVFADATNYPCIITLNRQKLEYYDFRCVRVNTKREKILDEITENFELEKYLERGLDIFSCDKKTLQDTDWAIMPKIERSVFKKVELKCEFRLGEKTEMFMGIHHSPVDVLIIDKQTKEKYRLGDDEVKPVLAGKKDVRKWRILWRGRYMPFPYSYDKEENKLLLFGLEQHENLGKYLIENKNALENRKFFRKKITEYGKKWYELWNPHWFERPKIITPDISEKNNFTYDENYFVNVDIYTIFPNNKDPKFIKYLLGCLNSSTLEFYHKHISPFLQGKYYRYKREYLERFPIRLPQTPAEQDLADEITKKVTQILEQIKLEQQIENFPDEYLQEYRSRGNEFESLNITFKSNHKALEPVIEEDTTGIGYNIIFGKKEKPVFVDSTAKAYYVVTALKGTKARKDEKKQVLIPKSDAIVEEILNNLVGDKAQINSPSVAELEDAINELVYTLYGLNEKDVAVIDDFLRRF